MIKVSMSDVAIVSSAKASMAKGESWADTLVAMANETPIELNKPKLPGGVKPVFKEEAKAGLLTKDVYGEFTSEALFDRSFLQIKAGRYTGSVKFSKTSGATLGGYEPLGNMAAKSFVEAMAQADDIVTQDWANRLAKACEAEVKAQAEAEAKAKADAKPNRKSAKSPA